MLSQFQKVGNDLFVSGLVSSHSGNLSIRLGDRLIITKRGSMLGRLQQSDLVETGISQNNRFTPLASTELAVHRAIYKRTSAQAVVHAHPPHAITLSLIQEELTPVDVEGSHFLGKVTVIAGPQPVKPGTLAESIAQALKEHLIVLVRGHGSFAIGQLMEEAYHWTSLLEESCRVLYLLNSLGKSSRRVKPIDSSI